MNRFSDSIAEKFRTLHRTLISVEFFPPKTEEGARQILDTAKSVRQTKPPDNIVLGVQYSQKFPISAMFVCRFNWKRLKIRLEILGIISDGMQQ